MAMDTNVASAITRSTRRLKDLATDAISVPSLQELADRKSVELADARRKHDDIVARQIKIEGTNNRRGGDNTAIIAEKAKSAELINRLQNESGLLKDQLRAANPKPKLTPEMVRQQMVDGAIDRRPGNGTPEQIAAARKTVDELSFKARLARMDGMQHEAKITPSLNEARLQLLWLEGPPYQLSYVPWLQGELRERFNAMCAKRGKK